MRSLRCDSRRFAGSFKRLDATWFVRVMTGNRLENSSRGPIDAGLSHPAKPVWIPFPYCRALWSRGSGHGRSRLRRRGFQTTSLVCTRSRRIQRVRFHQRRALYSDEQSGERGQVEKIPEVEKGNRRKISKIRYRQAETRNLDVTHFRVLPRFL